MKKKKLLITGFEPFHGGTVNPSWEAVAALPEQIGEWELTKLRIPVIFGEAGEAVLKKAETLGPDVILCVGQAGGRNAVTPEVLAVNVKDAPFPDNAGQLPVREPVVPGGECAYFSTVPVRNLVRKVREAGISCRLSYSAGVYVCNDVLYRVLERYHGTETKAGFVHVPFLPEQAGEGQPSMTLEEMTRALTAAVMALDGDCAAEYRSIGTEEICRELFRDFTRRQEVTKCWRRDGDAWTVRDVPFTDDWSEEDYKTLVSRLKKTAASGGLVYGAFCHGKLTGFAAVEPEFFGGEHRYLDLSFLHVSQDYRGQGIGTELFQAAREWAGRKGAKKLYISAHSAVETQAFYRRMGCGEAQAYHPGHVLEEPFDCQLELEI